MIKKLISSILIITVAVCSMVTAFAADVNLTDIDSSHWAYAAIAELVGKKTVNGYPDGSFKPNGIVTYAEFEKMITGVWKNNPAPINREAALDMLWSYSGSPVNYSAPGIITNQMVNKDAAAWGYTTGLMQGNDGLNLRPSDTLTRAEAATLIVRSTKTIEGDHSFAASIDEAILKFVWDEYALFDSEYVAADTITAEALWTATKKLGGIKSTDITVTDATVGDAFTLLNYAACLQSNQIIGAKSVEGVSDKYGSFAQIYEAFALENGFDISADRNAPATKRDIALILVQLDASIGRGGHRINKNIAQYPANHADYAHLTEGVPVYVYTVPFGLDAKPVDSYGLASSYSFIFEQFAEDMSKKYGQGKATFTFIPTLLCQDGTDLIMRVKCTVKEGTGAQIFGAGFESAGSEFYLDLHAGEPASALYISTNDASIGKFICNQ